MRVPLRVFGEYNVYGANHYNFIWLVTYPHPAYYTGYQVELVDIVPQRVMHNSNCEF